MARRIPTLVVLLPLLAACATTAPVGEARVATSPDGELVYLQGVTTRYSVRLDELRAKQGRSRVDRLPHAVVAGDATMTVAGSLMRHPDAFVLDLVVRNHGDQSLELDRAQITLTDDEDRLLTPRSDWARGVDYGLRAMHVRDRGSRHMGTDHQAGQAGVRGDNTRLTTKPQVVPATRSQSPALKVGETPMDVTWITDLSIQKDLVSVPTKLAIAPGEGTTYWAYWNADTVSFPLTVSVRIGGKRMLLRFDEPRDSALAR